MGPHPKLPYRPGLRPRPARGACALLALAGAVGGLLLTAPGSQAGAAVSGSQGKRHPGYHRGVASWYYDRGHPTACGFHAKYGVANRTLPCGTHVKFIHNGHRITGVVDDRGPYVQGRTWDLGQRARKALHVSGVEWVWAKW
jgi:rare lipoprotein A (peptidoglycan hydrolase)